MSDQKPDCIIASVGGGGLFCGLIEGLIKHGWMDKGVDLIAVETQGANCFNLSIQNNCLYTMDQITSVAKTLGAKTCARTLFEYFEKYRESIKSIVVSDKEAVDACFRFLGSF